MPSQSTLMRFTNPILFRIANSFRLAHAMTPVPLILQPAPAARCHQTRARFTMLTRARHINVNACVVHNFNACAVYNFNACVTRHFNSCVVHHFNADVTTATAIILTAIPTRAWFTISTRALLTIFRSAKMFKTDLSKSGTCHSSPPYISFL